MNRTTRILGLVLCSLLAVGCEKSSDVGRMHQEGIDQVGRFEPRVNEMGRRLLSLGQRASVLDPNLPGVAEARQKLMAASAMVGQARSIVTAVTKSGAGHAPSELEVATQSNSVEEIERVTVKLREQLEKTTTEANSDLDAVDSWVSIAETRPVVAAMRPGATTPDPASP